jgi:uncharacterized Zn-binding protein involved in type VI secretion
MPFPSSRLFDMHVCPAFTGPVPHVGGPITGPGNPTVITFSMVQSKQTDLCVCVGPPDTVVMGAPTVQTLGLPLTRITSNCAHGGMVVLGAPTVLVGP